MPPQYPLVKHYVAGLTGHRSAESYAMNKALLSVSAFLGGGQKLQPMARKVISPLEIAAL